mmetsp:Transcript_3854/g.9105  ORF Transcript_3854/g.9105 Transcript_3854/m.9105 type:complete len:329 (+) Transcript_3854:662-1648(+)
MINTSSNSSEKLKEMRRGYALARRAVNTSNGIRRLFGVPVITAEVEKRSASATKTVESSSNRSGQLDSSYPNLDIPPSGVAETGFHEVNLTTPGLQLISRAPNVFLVHDFLTSSECDAIVTMAGSDMVPSLCGAWQKKWSETHSRHYYANWQTGESRWDKPKDPNVDASETRTSTAARVEKADVPAIISRITALLGDCDKRQLEAFSVLRYDAGQFFKPHADVWQHGKWSSGGFTDSTRLATVFVYLNDVQEGGETRFTRLKPCPLVIRPKKGMAVVHFPARRDPHFGFRHDWPRTEHESAPAVDEKWIFATWMWANFEDEEPAAALQ